MLRHKQSHASIQPNYGMVMRSKSYFGNLLKPYTAYSKKAVLRKSKIQITEYKINKVCHITHMTGLVTSSP